MAIYEPSEVAFDEAPAGGTEYSPADVVFDDEPQSEVAYKGVPGVKRVQIPQMTTQPQQTTEEEDWGKLIGKSVMGGFGSIGTAGLGVAQAGIELTGFEPSETITDIAKTTQEYWTPAVGESAAKKYVAGIAQSLAGSTPLLLAGPAALPLFGATSFGNKYLQMREHKQAVGPSVLGAGVVGVSEAVTEIPVYKALFNPATKSLLRRAINTIWKELPGEEVNTAVESIVDKVTIRPDMSFRDYLKDAVDTAIITIGQTGTQAAMLHPVIKHTTNIAKKEQEKVLTDPQSTDEDKVVAADFLASLESDENKGLELNNRLLNGIKEGRTISIGEKGGYEISEAPIKAPPTAKRGKKEGADRQGLLPLGEGVATTPAIEAEPVAEEPVAIGKPAGIATDRRTGSGKARRQKIQALLDIGDVEGAHDLMYMDNKTGLLNAKAWDEIDTAPESADRVRASLDISGLGWINDNFGHNAGDALLKVAGEEIKAAGIEGYRKGGDELSALFKPEEQADELLKKAQDAVSKRVIDVVTPEGKKYSYTGWRLDYGTGKTFDEADAALYKGRAAQVEAGFRGTTKGAKPLSVVEAVSQGVETVSAPQGIIEPAQPARRKAKAEADTEISITDFIRKYGGLSLEKESLKGEIRDRLTIKEGYNLVNNKTGHTLDDMTGAAIAGGFLSEGASVRDLLDAINNDVTAKKAKTQTGRAWSIFKQDFEIPEQPAPEAPRIGKDQEMFAGINKAPLKTGLKTEKAQAEDLLEGFRKPEEDKQAGLFKEGAKPAQKAIVPVLENINLEAIPEGLTLEIKAIREKTGKEVTVKEDAKTAIMDSQETVDKYAALLECLRA